MKFFQWNAENWQGYQFLAKSDVGSLTKNEISQKLTGILSQKFTLVLMRLIGRYIQNFSFLWLDTASQISYGVDQNLVFPGQKTFFGGLTRINFSLR